MKKFLKILVYTFAGIFSSAMIMYGVAYQRTETQMNRIYQVQSEAIKIPTDSASIAWGKHIVEMHGCQKCHGDDLGGKIFMDDLALGRMVAPNLTGGRGGVQRQRCAHDWVRAIRHGIGVDGKPLLVMPSQDYYFLSNENLGEVIAYLKQVPPVDHELPALRVGPLARLLYQFGKLDVLIPAASIAHQASRPDSPPAGVTPAYGRRLLPGLPR